MKYDVVTYGDAALRHKAEPVLAIDARIRKLASEMLETMYASNGLGLAAEQIGRTESICVIDVPASMNARQPNAGLSADLPMPLVMINPRITDMQGEQVGQEGCLSFPEVFISIRRAQTVTAVFTNLHGEAQTVHASGLVARAIQHEMDHLNGILLIDRMSAVQKVAVSGRLRKLKKAPVHRLREVTAALA